LTTNLRRVLCAHRHLATSLQNQCSHLTSKARTRVSARIYQVRAFQKSFCESTKDERIYVFQIQIRSNNFISKFNPNPKSDSFQIQILLNPKPCHYWLDVRQCLFSLLNQKLY